MELKLLSTDFPFGFSSFRPAITSNTNLSYRAFSRLIKLEILTRILKFVYSSVFGEPSVMRGGVAKKTTRVENEIVEKWLGRRCFDFCSRINTANVLMIVIA